MAGTRSSVIPDWELIEPLPLEYDDDLAIARLAWPHARVGRLSDPAFRRARSACPLVPSRSTPSIRLVGRGGLLMP
jgi:hypothetical protein